MSSLLRIVGTVKSGGKKIINLTKMSSIEIDKNQIIYTYDNVRNVTSGGMFLFSGGDTRQESYTFENEAIAQQEFDSIHKALNNYYKN